MAYSWGLLSTYLPTGVILQVTPSFINLKLPWGTAVDGCLATWATKKKLGYFPLNPGWLIGILTVDYYHPHITSYNWVVYGFKTPGVHEILDWFFLGIPYFHGLCYQPHHNSRDPYNKPLGVPPLLLDVALFRPKGLENTNIQREAWINNVTTRRICLKCRFGSTLKNREPKKIYLVGFSPTQCEKYATVNLDHETQGSGWKFKHFWGTPPPRNAWSFTKKMFRYLKYP